MIHAKAFPDQQPLLSGFKDGLGRAFGEVDIPFEECNAIFIILLAPLKRLHLVHGIGHGFLIVPWVRCLVQKHGGRDGAKQICLLKRARRGEDRIRFKGRDQFNVKWVRDWDGGDVIPCQGHPVRRRHRRQVVLACFRVEACHRGDKRHAHLSRQARRAEAEQSKRQETSRGRQPQNLIATNAR